MQVDYDSKSDTLYIKNNGSEIIDNKQEGYLIKNFNSENQVVGVVVLGISSITVKQWSSNVEREALPKNIVDTIDSWIFQGIENVNDY
jgi:uncharacterized protein YuzE